jgi:hypothetical protein
MPDEYFMMSVKMKKNFDELILEAIEKEFIDKIRDNYKSLMGRVETAMNETVHENALVFMPNDRQAGELGIQGKIGARDIDEEKRSGAWRILLTTHPNTAAVIKAEKLQGTDIARITFGWDKEKFYLNPKSMVTVYNLKEGTRLEYSWMKTFVEGKVISGYTFSPYDHPNSRTGEGIMVKGGVWQFPPSPFNLEWLSKKAAEYVRDRLDFLFSRGKASFDVLTQGRRDV